MISSNLILAALGALAPVLAMPVLPQASSTIRPQVTDGKSKRMDGTLEAVNATHVTLSLVNKGASDINLLAWSNALDSSTAFQSFELEGRLANGTLVYPDAGPSMVLKEYPAPGQEQFVTIPVGQAFTGTYDLTTLFAVPESGAYNVSVTEDSFFAAADPAQPNELNPVHVRCEYITMSLQASTAAPAAPVGPTAPLAPTPAAPAPLAPTPVAPAPLVSTPAATPTQPVV
ncbi:MAG: hypothetical protein M1832_004992 [Thelocarpon impressellum]|nr:MAG: hypothetical protein M1832_004992 [Thelocarpon impressellum]